MKKYFLYASGLFAIALVIGIVMQQPSVYKPCALATAISLAIGLGSVPSLKGYQYTAWIISAVVAGMFFPEWFNDWAGVKPNDKLLMLTIIQLVMFGTGTQMSIKEFSGIKSTGKGVAVGMLCQFTVMPLTGFLLTKIFNFEPEIAAGVILIGCCSSGLASNVMVYLAKANLMLSVLVTAMATLVAPILTPLMMKLLAGTLVKVPFVDMMVEIIKIVIVPIGAALLSDYLFSASKNQKRNIYTAGIICIGWILFYLSFNSSSIHPAVQQSLGLSVYMAGAVVVGIIYYSLVKAFPAIKKNMPYISMFGIIYFTVITTAVGRNNLLNVGVVLFLAAVLHNTAGYFLGYWISRLFKLDRPSARTISFEVGLQNGGMASGVARSMDMLGTVGLAAAVFSPWMNISGSILANYWRKKSLSENDSKK